MKGFLKKRKTLLLGCLAIVGVLVAAFVWGGNYSKNQTAKAVAAETIMTASSPEAPLTDSGDITAPSESPSAPTQTAAPEAAAQPSSAAPSQKTAVLGATLTTSPAPTPSATENTAVTGQKINPETGKDPYMTDPVPSGKPLPVEPQDAKINDNPLTCTLTVRCDTILNNMDLLSEDKHELVPADGVILPATTVTFYEGESVFNVLQREMKKVKIQMEFEKTPIYNSAYIESINNLYEFDVGELSGWMYKVGDWFPNYGCSRYQIEDGDVIEWVYTCDLGKDVGGYSSTGG